jgi:hypothetical protein
MKTPALASYSDTDGLFVLFMQGLLPGNGNLSMLEGMRNRGEIGQLVYSLFLNREYVGWIAAQNSTILLGNWNLSRFSDASEFTYVPAISPDSSWKVLVSNPQLGSQKLSPEGQFALISTTKSRLIVPSKVYKAMYGAICDSWFRSCLSRSNKVLWNCSETPQSRFADLRFSIDTLEVTFTAEEYTQRYYSDYCELCFESGEGWVLGTAFLRKYYTLFDGERRRIGFAVARHDSEMATWLMILLITAAIVIVCIAVICGYYAVKKQRNKQKFVELERFNNN